MKNFISSLSSFAAAALAVALTLVPAADSRAAGPFNVNIPGDTHAVNPAVSQFDSGGNVSLRSAIEAANVQSGVTIINVPAGTYTLTLGELDVSPSGSKTISILGANPATTIVSQGDGNNRVFNIDVNSAGGSVATLSGITIQGGTDKADNFGGAGILDGSIASTPRDVLTLTNCLIRNNHCRALNSSGNGGGGVQMAGGDLSITSCTFSNNSSGSSPGGAVYFFPQNVTSVLTVSGSLFVSNAIADATGAGIGGAAIYLGSSAATSTHTITGCTFLGNSVSSTFTGGKVYGAVQILESGANNFVNITTCSFVSNSVTSANHLTGSGAALAVNSGKVTMNFCRLFANVSDSTADTLFSSVANAASVSAQNNWWGCNSGPDQSGCGFITGDGVNGSFGSTVTFNPWIVLDAFFDQASINVNNSATLTGSFLQNSSGTQLTTANVSVLNGVPVVFKNAVLGNLFNEAPMIENGGATAGFTGTAAGTGHADVMVDNATVTANITINSTQPPIVTVNPTNLSVCAGSTAIFMTAASGSPTPTLQWQVSTDGGTTFSNLSVTTTTLSFTATPAQSGNEYRAIFTNSGGSATNTPATLTVNSAPVVTSDPISQSVTAGQNATFSAAASGSPTPTVQWQVSTDSGGSFNNIGSATSTTLSFATTLAENGSQYRAVFTGPCGSTNTTAATLTVTAATGNPPTITLQPMSQTVCPNSIATFMAAATGTPTPTVDWMVSSNHGSTFLDLHVTTTALSFTATPSQDGNEYRAVFSNTGGVTNSLAATLTVNAPPVAGADKLGVTEGKSVNAPIAKLLANDSSPIGGTLSITGVTSPSTTGGTVVLNGSVITYTPMAGFFGSDSFTYTLSDTRCTAQGTVNVTVTSTNAPSANTISITLTSTGRVVLFAGVPGATYVVQYSDTGNGPWTDFADGTIVASSTGLIQYTDSTSPIPPARFYRTRVGP